MSDAESRLLSFKNSYNCEIQKVNDVLAENEIKYTQNIK